MTDPEKLTDQKTPVRPYYIIMIGTLIFIAIVAVIIFFIGGNKNSGEPNSTDDPQNSIQIQSDPPTINKVETTLDEKNVSFKVETSDYKTTDYKLEYELADQNRKVVKTDVDTGTSFTIQTRNTGSAYYRLKVRLQDPETKQTSSWSEAYTIKLEEVQGVQKLEPAQAYYDTLWAKGEGGKDNLINALQVAYNAKETTEVTGCIPLNSGTMKPTLLLPPNPNVTPKGAALNFTVNSWDAGKNEGNITYFWC